MLSTPRDTVLQSKMRADEAADIKQAANAAGLTPSSFIRDVVLAALAANTSATTIRP